MTVSSIRCVRPAALVVAFLVGLTALAPAALAYPSGQPATGAISATVVPAGGTVTVTVEHTTPGALTMQLFSAPVTIGSGSVGADGTGSVVGTIPAGYAGPHTVQVTADGGEVFPFGIRVTATPTFPDVSFGYSCHGPGDVVVAARLGGATVGSTYQLGVSTTDGRGTDASATVTATSTSLTLTAELSTAPRELAVDLSEGAVSTGGRLRVDCGTPGPDDRGNGTLATTGARAGLGAGLGLALLLVGAVVVVAGRPRRSGHHRG